MGQAQQCARGLYLKNNDTSVE